MIDERRENDDPAVAPIRRRRDVVTDAVGRDGRLSQCVAPFLLLELRRHVAVVRVASVSWDWSRTACRQVVYIIPVTNVLVTQICDVSCYCQQPAYIPPLWLTAELTPKHTFVRLMRIIYYVATVQVVLLTLYLKKRIRCRA